MSAISKYLDSLYQKIESEAENCPSNEEIEEITIQAVTFLSRFNEYAEGYKEFLLFQKKDIRSGICNNMVTQLIDTIDTKAKLLEKEPILRTFYLLNNFAYVLNKTNNSMDGLISKEKINEFLEKRIKESLAEYEHFTYFSIIICIIIKKMV